MENSTSINSEKPKFKISSIVKMIRKHKVVSTVTVVTLLLILVGGYFIYQFNQPVRIVTAAQFSGSEKQSVEFIQSQEVDYFIIKNSGMYILDIRSEQEYAKEHIKGALSVPFERIKQGFGLPTDRKIAVYSTVERIEEASEAAEIIKKEVKVEVYLIKDGFEGLKEQGLKTEQGLLR